MALVAAVIIAAVVQLIRSRGDWWRPVAAVLLAPLGLAGYWAFVAWATRHASEWFWVERHFWVQENQPRTPFNGMRETWHELETVLLAGAKQPLMLVTLITVAAVVLLTLGTGWYYASMPRYLLPALILALPLARLLAQAPMRVLIPLIGFLAAASAWFGVYMMTIAGLAP